NKPFIAINCAAIPEQLLESELFGYVKGAFTGASANGKTGLIQAANTGTLFLDEIGDMPLMLQAKLLRAIEAREILPIGASS
ncbi:sigma 54-interacting transcriptional regulator, partial [Pseudomonas aeruginosa]